MTVDKIGNVRKRFMFGKNVKIECMLCRKKIIRKMLSIYEILLLEYGDNIIDIRETVEDC